MLFKRDQKKIDRKDTPVLVGTKKYKVPYIEINTKQETPVKKVEEKKI